MPLHVLALPTPLQIINESNSLRPPLKRKHQLSVRSEMPSPSQSEIGERLDRRLLLLQLGLYEILNRNDPDDFPLLVQKGQMPNVLHQHFRHAPGNGLTGRCSDEVGALRRDFFNDAKVWTRTLVWTMRFDCVEERYPNDRRKIDGKIRTFDWGHLGGLAEEGDFADVVALTDDSGDIPCLRIQEIAFESRYRKHSMPQFHDEYIRVANFFLTLGVDGDETPDVVSGEFLDGIVNWEVLVDGVIDAGVATLVPGIGGGEALLDRCEADAEFGLVTTGRLRGEGTGDSGGDGEHHLSIWQRARRWR